MTWKKASGTGAVIAAWGGFFLAIIGWLIAARVQGGTVTVASLGTNGVMLSGNLIAILSSATIHYFWSVFVDPHDFDFSELDTHISLVEEDMRGLSDEEKDPVQLRRAERWIKRRGYALTVILIIIWPILSIPAGVFSRSYFAFWVLISIAWGFGAAIVITVLPLAESSEDINTVLSGIYNKITGRSPVRAEDPNMKTVEQADKKEVEMDSADADSGDQTVTPPGELEEVEA